MRRRWRKWQIALVVAAIAALLWGATYYDDASASLSIFSRRIAAVVDWLCPMDSNGERGECGIDDGKEADAPPDELEDLRLTIDALPLAWTTDSLFSAETTLCLSGGQRVVLRWPARADEAERVLTGRISLQRGTADMTYTAASGPSRASRQQLNRSRPATRVVVATTVGAVLELSCLGNSSCRLVLGDDSGDLPGDRQC